MALTVTHSTPADGTFSAGGVTAWDANHSIAGLGAGVEIALAVNTGATGAILTNGGVLVGSSETLATGAITASTPVVDAAQTWNAVGTTFAGFKLTVTDTASAAGSNAIEVKGGASGTTNLFTLDKAGTATFNGATPIVVGNIGVGNGVSNTLSNGTLALNTSGAGSQMDFYVNAGLRVRIPNANNIQIGSSVDVGFGRNASGVGEVNNGTLGTYGDLKVRAIQHNGQKFANLPTGVAGMTAYVTDSTVNTWGATIAGGGANKVLAFYNGTNWTVAGA